MIVSHESAWHPFPQPKVWDPDYTPTVYVVGWRNEGVVKVGYYLECFRIHPGLWPVLPTGMEF